jgi:hypothetical protein
MKHEEDSGRDAGGWLDERRRWEDNAHHAMGKEAMVSVDQGKPSCFERYLLYLGPVRGALARCTWDCLALVP